MPTNFLAESGVAADNGLQAGNSGAAQAKTGAFSRQIALSGTVESTEQSITISTGATEYVATLETDSGDTTHVDGKDPNGTWTVKLNVATTSSDIQWSEVWIHERSSGGTYTTLASLTGQTVALTSTGVVSMQATASSQSNISTGSTIVVVVVFTAVGGHNPGVGITPDQTDTVIAPWSSAVSTTKTFDLDAAIQAAAVTKTWNLDGVVQAAAQTKTFDLDAIVKAIETKTWDLDAAIQAAGQTKTFELDAVLQGNVTLEQSSFRWRNDDGSESAATWSRAESVGDITDELGIALARFDLDVTLRLRIRIRETAGGDAAPTGFQLQYRKNAGSWLDVNAGSSNARSKASPNVTDGAATTEQLTLGAGSGSFVAGSFDEVDGAVASIDLAANGYTEVEFAFELRSADLANGDDLDFRVVKAGGATLDTYTNAETPRLTLASNTLVCRLLVDSTTPGDPMVSTGHVVYTDLRKDLAAGETVDAIVHVESPLGTEIERFEHFALDETGGELADTLSNAAADLIPSVAYRGDEVNSDIYVGVTPRKRGGTARELRNIGIQFETPSAKLLVTKKTLSFDGLIQAADQTKTWDLDALVQDAGRTVSVLLDAAIQLIGGTSTWDLDAAIQAAAVTKTWDLDALVQAIQTKTFDLDALVQAIQTKTFDLDALVQAADQTSTWNLDAVLQAIQTITFALDAVLVGAGASTITWQLDGLLQALAVTKTWNLDAHVQAADQTKTFDLDAAIQAAALTKTWDLDAILTGSAGITFELDAAIQAVGVTKTWDLDALVQALAQTKTWDLDALVQASAQTSSWDLDAILRSVGLTKTWDLDAAILELDRSISFSVDGILIDFQPVDPSPRRTHYVDPRPGARPAGRRSALYVDPRKGAPDA